MDVIGIYISLLFRENLKKQHRYYIQWCSQGENINRRKKIKELDTEEHQYFDQCDQHA